MTNSTALRLAAVLGLLGLAVQPASAEERAKDLFGAEKLPTATAAQSEPPYRVRIRVPARGIGGIRFGLRGTSCGPSGCKPSPVFFALR